MKRTILSLVLALVTIFTFAQTESSHLTFKGVPIDGTMSQFVQNMQQKGFTSIGTQDGISLLTGDFAGYKDCLVGVSTLKQKDLVSTIVVIFPDRDTWSSLYGNYVSLKEMLTEKYGEPSEVVEKFDRYSEPSDDNTRMHCVKFDECKYFSIFQNENGNIELQISHDGVTKCFVVLRYVDKRNYLEVRLKAIDDL